MDSSILEYMAEKNWFSVDIQTILEDEGFKKLNPSSKKGRKKKTTEERVGVIDPVRCDARVWKEGYDNIQCDNKKLEGECLCAGHLDMLKKNRLWLGMINEPRPENPVSNNGVQHHWLFDKEGNKVEPDKKKPQKEETNVVKRKRGRPKGSKNRNKKSKNEIPKMSKEEILTLLEKKMKEKEEIDKEEKNEDEGGKEEKKYVEKTDGVEKEKEEEEEEEDIIYLVDNVPYEINGGEVIDPEDYSPMGKPDGKGGIIFEDEFTEQRHQENINKYGK